MQLTTADEKIEYLVRKTPPENFAVSYTNANDPHDYIDSVMLQYVGADGYVDTTLLTQALEQVGNYEIELKAKTSDELEKLYKDEFEKDKKSLESEITDEAKRTNGRGFPSERLQPDFEYWSIKPEWSLSEGISLSLGINPDIKWDEQSARFYNWPIIFELNRKMEKLKKFASLKFKDNKINPQEYIKWCSDNSIEFPKELENLTIKRHEKAIESGTDVEDKKIIEKLKTENENLKDQISKNELNHKMRATFQKMVLAVAIKYKFNPSNSKNPSTAQFRNVLDKAGLSIDDNTIRATINNAYEIYKDSIDQSIFEN